MVCTSVIVLVHYNALVLCTLTIVLVCGTSGFSCVLVDVHENMYFTSIHFKLVILVQGICRRNSRSPVTLHE